MQRRKAVVVDDDGIMGSAIAHVLDRMHFEVHLFRTGFEALAAVREIEPDLVTLDLSLPDVEGIELCRRMRAASDCYVIVLSARDDEFDRLLSLEVGADDFMAKPFSLRELQARVAAMFRRPRSADAARGVVATASAVPRIPSPRSSGEIDGGAGLLVDRHARLVTIEGRAVSLTRTEFDLLLHLATHDGVVLPREELMRDVWDTHHVPGDTHLVDVHVANLRRKLRGHAATPWIHTVRGVGFRFDRAHGLRDRATA